MNLPKVSNIKKNWEAMQQDPYIAIKMQSRFTTYFVYFIMILISITFFWIIYSFKSGSSFGSILVKGFMIIIWGYMLFKIYTSAILPQRKIIAHYENAPVEIAHKHIDVKAEVDDILSKFDKEGKRIK